MKNLIYDMLISSQLDSDRMYTLIDKFDPLISKWARILNYEDSKNDIIAEFIYKVKLLNCKKLEMKDDIDLLIYIKRCIENISHNLFKKKMKQERIKVIVVSEYCQKDGRCIWDNVDHYEDDYPFLIQDILQKSLTKREAEIMNYIVFKGYSLQKISSIYKVSPEAISISKRRACNKLKKYFETIQI